MLSLTHSKNAEQMLKLYDNLMLTLAYKIASLKKCVHIRDNAYEVWNTIAKLQPYLK